jgi:HSP20 family protein
MTLVRRTNNLFPAFPNILENWFGKDLTEWNDVNLWGTNATMPAVNVKEETDKFEIEVAAPGLTKEDFQVKLENNVLTISSEKKEEKKEEDKNYTRREFSYQSFQRSFNLPEGHIHADKISARYNDGILRIELPKRDEVKPQPMKEIKIS